MCLRFHYLYLDSRNFKRSGFVDFLVSQIPDLFSEIKFIKSNLIDGLYFNPSAFQFPNQDSSNSNSKQNWYEFSHLEWLQKGFGELDWEIWKKGMGRVDFSLVR